MSCFAVIEAYLEAREPAVSLSANDEPLAGGAFAGFVTVLSRARFAGVVPGVTRPDENDGVVLPPADGVIRPLERELEAAGVIRPEIDGVVRPPREEATDDGRGTAPGPTVGGESFVVATKTPQLGGHEKYLVLEI